MRSLRALFLVATLLVASSATTYTLKAGDNLTKVARRFGVSVGELAKANGIVNPDLVVEGRRIAVPGPGPVPAAAAAPAGRAPVVGRTRHVVKRGETLASIAAKYDTTVAELKQLNALANVNRIVAGKSLTVPGAAQWLCPVQGFHTVVNNYGAPRPGRRSHRGNDIFAARGTPVVAPVSGTLRAASGKVAGLAVYLNGDDGTTYYFAHLNSLARSSGAVDAGTLIGSVGNTGNASSLPPHLHVSVAPGGGEPINPWATLRQGC